MKYLVVSDIHGSLFYASKIIEIMKKENIDKLILLGDLYYHGPRNPLPKEYNPMEVSKLLNGLKDKLICVKGNCVNKSSVDFKSVFTDTGINHMLHQKDIDNKILQRNVFCNQQSNLIQP